MKWKNYGYRVTLILVTLIFVIFIPSALAHRSGGYSHDSSIGYNNPDWMGDLPDSLKLSELSIPGTHDSGTFPGKGGDLVQCQSMSIKDQLESGIRALDIRCRHIENVFTIHHGAYYQGLTFGEDVLKPVVDFLRAYPSETILMRVKEEHDPERITRSFAETFDWYINEVWYYDGDTPIAPYGQWVWQPNSYNPTLGEVRGKIVILQDFWSNKNFGLKYGHNPPIQDIQDEYELCYHSELKTKWEQHVKIYLEKADKLVVDDRDNMKTIYINYLSGAMKEAGCALVFPYFVASGHSSPGTGDPRLWMGHCGNCGEYHENEVGCCYYEGTNELTLNYIEAGKVNNRIGIIMADFPARDLIKEIIGLNPWNWPPVADANGPYVGSEGSEIIFDASASSDPDGDALQYRWDFNDDGSWDTDWSPGPTAGYTWYDDWEGTVKVEVSDGKSTATAAAAVTVNNVDPTAEIDDSEAVLVNGTPTFLAHAGESMNFAGRATDPGSDDLFLGWDWGDGSPVVTVEDLAPLPLAPRDVTDLRTHTFSDACMYDISFLVDDDDGGHGEDQATVMITGNADKARSEGYWQHQYGGQGKTDFDEATLNCYLAIVDHVSTVFNEERDASTIEQAHDVLFLKQNQGSEREQLDRELLTVWLNFANGAREYVEMLDTDKDGVGDTLFGDLMAAAEAVRLDPAATDKEIREQTNILHHVKQMKGYPVNQPLAEFNANSTTGPAPLVVAFRDWSLGNPSSWVWDFGDGTTSTEQHPSHTYVETVSFTVTLTVSNEFGADTTIDPACINVAAQADGEKSIYLPLILKESQ